MEKIKLGKSGLLVPPIALGCMRLAGAERKQADAFLHTALELELNFFDHADIYGGGACERVFGEMIKDAGVRREDLIIQSKCAIVPGKMYDFSKEHILSAVDGSLKRLGTDYLDVLLLHRPDALMEPEEVAEAFDELEKSGKVRHFGVSNEDPYTMELLQSALHQPICANQLQMSLTNATMIAQPMNTNICDGLNPVLDNGVLNYCHHSDVVAVPARLLRGCFHRQRKIPEAKRKARRAGGKIQRDKHRHSACVDSASPCKNAGRHGHHQSKAPARLRRRA